MSARHDDTRGPRPRPVPRPAQDRRAQRAGPAWPARPVRRCRAPSRSPAAGATTRQLVVEPRPRRAAGQAAAGRPPAVAATRTSRSPTARSRRRRPAPTRATAPTVPTCSAESGVVRSDITSQLRRRVGRGRGRAADDPAEGLRPQRRRTRRSSPAPRSTCGTATARAGTRCTTRRSPTRTTCAASRRPTTTGWVEFTSIFPAATTAAGRTCTSRSTRPSTTPPTRPTSCAPRSWRCPKDACDEVYATRRLRGQRGQPGPDLAGHRHGVRRRLLAAAGQGDRQSVDEGYVATLNVPV